MLNHFRTFFMPDSASIKFDNDFLSCNYNKDDIYDELKIKRQTIDNARHELPKTESQQPDNVEDSIGMYIKNKISKLTELVNKKHKEFTNSLKDFSLNKAEPEIENITELSEKEINSLLLKNEAVLEQLHNDYINVKNDFENFKDKNKLDHEPNYPDSNLFSYSLLFFMIVLESILNGIFFAKGSDLGLVGGVGTALGISLVNILIAVFFTGIILMRYKNHISVVKKTISWIFLLLYSMALFIFNLSVAHYRDSMSINTEGAFEVAVNNLITTPFYLIELESWMLFCLGILFAIIAAYKGLELDDKYPKYGIHHRRVEEKWENYISERNDIQEEIEEIKYKFDKDLESLSTDVNNNYRLLNLFYQEIKGLPSQYILCRSQLEQIGISLISDMRMLNLKHRKTPQPKFYDEPWYIEEKFSPIDEIPSYKDDINKREQFRNAFPEILSNRKKEIYDVFDNALNKLNKFEKQNKN